MQNQWFYFSLQNFRISLFSIVKSFTVTMHLTQMPLLKKAFISSEYYPDLLLTCQQEIFGLTEKQHVSFCFHSPDGHMKSKSVQVSRCCDDKVIEQVFRSLFRVKEQYLT